MGLHTCWAAELHVNVLPARRTAVAKAVLRVQVQRHRLPDDNALQCFAPQAAPAQQVAATKCQHQCRVVIYTRE